ncbi:hypothetical protein [Gloeobacter kilaueensis]|uniref:Uncharacterized protein n=1 Tax=Gloeobacter kilaueensis (strain ATCC BAA-2537 / CCAP 1431/1 / ULC 316 / JS1) TaxID=1183438 RepID=U5QMS2_GLOK1|nr:hypothetical protein [Gloeobacter kilaueensis]AGY60198.1 hypothetical protein GKIL_3952 [Gloeobacter kilaueensis JS1]
MADLRNILSNSDFVVVGGVATRLYMPERMTLDLDILILTKDAPEIYQRLEQAGARRLGELSIGGSSWRLEDGTSLDVLVSDEPWVPPALSTPNVSPDGLPVIALPYLVLMKLLSSRGVDIGDLSRMLGQADDQALDEIRAVVGTYLADAAEDLESLIVLGRLEVEER